MRGMITLLNVFLFALGIFIVIVSDLSGWMYFILGILIGWHNGLAIAIVLEE